MSSQQDSTMTDDNASSSSSSSSISSLANDMDNVNINDADAGTLRNTITNEELELLNALGMPSCAAQNSVFARFDTFLDESVRIGNETFRLKYLYVSEDILTAYSEKISKTYLFERLKLFTVCIQLADHFNDQIAKPTNEIHDNNLTFNPYAEDNQESKELLKLKKLPLVNRRDIYEYFVKYNPTLEIRLCNACVDLDREAKSLKENGLITTNNTVNTLTNLPLLFIDEKKALLKLKYVTQQANITEKIYKILNLKNIQSQKTKNDGRI